MPLRSFIMTGGDYVFKRLKASKRGLTFSLSPNDVFKIGTRFRYLWDKGRNLIMIFPSDGFGNTVSRKCYGNKELPLIDIRSKVVRELVSKANYLDLEVLADSIVVHVIQSNDMEDEGIDDDIPVVSFVVPNNALDLSEYDEIIGELLTEQGLLKTGHKVKNDLNRVFSLLSLFSGCGAFDMPFHKDGFKIVFANEINPAAVMSYEANIMHEVCCMDIRDIKEEDVPQADVGIGGITCNPYASTNRKADKRLENSHEFELLDYYLKNMMIAHPKVFLIENVPKFADECTGNLEKIRKVAAGYEFSHKVLCDADLGGFSLRKRFILIGSRIGKIDIPDIEVFPKRTVKEALSKVSESWFNFNDITVPSEKTKMRMSYVKQGGNYMDMPEHLRNKSVHSNIFKRLHPDLPSVALPNFRKTNILHPTENRILSVSEASAIMGYDESFKFMGTLSSRQQQVGNAVPNAIATFCKAIVKSALIKYYENHDSILVN